MRRSRKLLLHTLLVAGVLTTSQILNITASFAIDGVTPQGTSGDLSIVIYPAAQERAFAVVICNNGTDDISSFNLDFQSTNLSVTEAITLPGGLAGSNVADSGSFDKNTGIWSGTLIGSTNALATLPDPLATPQCLAIGFVGTATGAIGQTIEFTATIVSSVLGDLTPNVDPTPGNDSATYTTAPIVLDPDLLIETRLLTTGDIVDTTPVSYEVTVKNIDAGQYVETLAQPLAIYFIIPTGATFVDVTDPDTGDNLDVISCTSLGNVNGLLPAFAGYDADLVGCQLAPGSGFIPAGAEYKLQFNMIANGPFSTGDTEVLISLFADDTDSLLLQALVYTPSTDPFSMDTNNNFVSLRFDNTALRATVNRCSGVGAIVTSNTACFTISFNKEIYTPSFDASDISVVNGEVDSLTQVGDNLWEIRLKSLVVNQIVSISLSPTNDIQDYSAVLAETQVLGVNTVRYEVAGTSAEELPSTGLKGSGDLWQYAISMLLAGFILLKISKRTNGKAIVDPQLF